MAISVETGHTKSAGGASLFSYRLKTSSKENAVLLLQIHGSQQEAKTLAKECETVVQHSLLETEGDAGERLDGVLKEMNGLLKGFLVARTIDDVHAIVAILGTDDVLSVSHAGMAEAYIVRGGQASQITEYTRGKPVPAFVHIASGPVEPKDTVIFSTQRLLRTVTPAQMAKLAARGGQLLDELKADLESEKEQAALAIMVSEGRRDVARLGEIQLSPKMRGGRRRGSRISDSLQFSGLAGRMFSPIFRISDLSWTGRIYDFVRGLPSRLVSDLRNPVKKKKTNLLIIAAVIAAFLVIWTIMNLATAGQRSQSRVELEKIIEQADMDLKNAENRYIAGDTSGANAILSRAQESAMSVMNHSSGRYRMEALDLLDRIRLKNEEINNITRLSPRVAVNLSSKNENVSAEGLIGLKDGELIAYDRQDLYRIVLNSVDEPSRLTEEELIADGAFFERMQTALFQLTDNSIVEIISGQATLMKTEDPSGWIGGQAVQAYLRFLYILSPENNQIYKYERLSNRYAAPAEYNVNGNLEGAIDFAIDGNVFVLKKGGEIVKLFRGEVRPFGMRHLPEDGFENVSRIFKAPEEGNLYFLDSVGSRVIVATDGGATGESAYVRQYILEGEQIGELKDLYVDPEQLHLYVLDGKRVYTVDLTGR